MIKQIQNINEEKAKTNQRYLNILMNDKLPQEDRDIMVVEFQLLKSNMTKEQERFLIQISIDADLTGE